MGHGTGSFSGMMGMGMGMGGPPMPPRAPPPPPPPPPPPMPVGPRVAEELMVPLKVPPPCRTMCFVKRCCVLVRLCVFCRAFSASSSVAPRNSIKHETFTKYIYASGLVVLPITGLSESAGHTVAPLIFSCRDSAPLSLVCCVARPPTGRPTGVRRV